jgi:hypothetical protein
MPKNIYCFETERLKGFQIGEAKESLIVEILLYFEEGTLIKLHIQGHQKGSIEPKYIDQIIKTFQEIS